MHRRGGKKTLKPWMDAQISQHTNIFVHLFCKSYSNKRLCSDYLYQNLIQQVRSGQLENINFKELPSSISNRNFAKAGEPCREMDGGKRRVGARNEMYFPSHSYSTASVHPAQTYYVHVHAHSLTPLEWDSDEDGWQA